MARRCLLALVLAGVMGWIGVGRAQGVSIVAAESAYGDLARQVAGPDARVVSVLNNPAADPHLFEPSPAVARAAAEAALVVMNGAGYDSWMAHLVAPGRTVLVVAALLNRAAGDNPHLCYDPAAAPALAQALAGALAVADPAHGRAYAERRDRLLASLAGLRARVAGLRARFDGVAVAATEPVFGLMLQAIGLRDGHGRFELAVMNGTEPRAGDIAAFEDDLRARRVRALITNAQTSSPASARLVQIALASGIAVVPVSETLPAGQDYQAWVGGALDRLEAALARPA